MKDITYMEYRIIKYLIQQKGSLVDERKTVLKGSRKLYITDIIKLCAKILPNTIPLILLASYSDKPCPHNHAFFVSTDANTCPCPYSEHVVS